MAGAETEADYVVPPSGYGGLTNRFSCDKPIRWVCIRHFASGFERSGAVPIHP